MPDKANQPESSPQQDKARQVEQTQELEESKKQKKPPYYWRDLLRTGIYYNAYRGIQHTEYTIHAKFQCMDAEISHLLATMFQEGKVDELNGNILDNLIEARKDEALARLDRQKARHSWLLYHADADWSRRLWQLQKRLNRLQEELYDDDEDAHKKSILSELADVRQKIDERDTDKYERKRSTRKYKDESHHEKLEDRKFFRENRSKAKRDLNERFWNWVSGWGRKASTAPASSPGDGGGGNDLSGNDAGENGKGYGE